MERKILVALNGSALDNWSCDYLLSGLFADQDDIHFHLLTIIPFRQADGVQALLGDLESLAQKDRGIQGKEVRARRHLDSLARRFWAKGFAKEQVSVECKLAVASTALTLLHLGQQELYDALLLSKREIPALLKFVSGSISADIMEKNHSLPLWVVNGAPVGDNFLVPVDCSPYSLAAVDHLGFMLRDNPTAQVTLFHSTSMLASDQISSPEEFYGRWGKKWCDLYLHGDDGREHFHFHASEQVLKEAGISGDRIHRLENKRGVEPAQTIAAMAREKVFSTIVMGRRPNKDKGIFRGVSDRVLANVKDVAVWLVG